ncbi:MAG: L-serine ammonia-lyase, iron-sulfur-dependent, subunit alpha [Bacilli bacterium]|nr:L-serine ammonia-lyase, iron-sulfur-dependent, subunit alpha [Bacilli bacterium]
MHSIKTLYKVGNGPSSSHTIGPKVASQFIIDKYKDCDYVKVTLFGSLAFTGKGHLTDYIIEKTFNENNIKVDVCFNYEILDLEFPNTMHFEIYKNKTILGEETIFSIGGGLIKVKDFENVEEKEVYPHKTILQIKEFCSQNNLSFVDYVLHFEDSSIVEFTEHIYQVMTQSVKNGLSKTGVLPGKLMVERKAHTIFNNIKPNETESMKEKRLVSSYAFACSEENASGGEIVTAPTCGSCGIIPSIIMYLEDCGYNHSDIINGLLVAGLFGLVVKDNASISGAECGCQAEIGTACAMGAALVATVKHLNNDQIERAAEIALEHHLGLTCDPILGYVQIPCIERNAVAALRAIESCSLAELFGESQSKISFDLVVETMKQTGIDLKYEYRETSAGGLAKNYIK